MQMDFCEAGTDPDVDGNMCSTLWEVVPRRGEFVGVMGELWIVDSVSYSAYIKDPNSDSMEPLAKGPLVTVFLTRSPKEIAES